MSHLIEEYAKNLGVKIAKPMVAKHFWPIAFDNYITICLDSEIPSKNYRYYEIVIDMIRNFIDKKGIKVIQIGKQKSFRLKNADCVMLDLPFKNNAYIISKSKLHIGIDNSLSHYASSIEVPIVNIFGNVYSSVSKGYWSRNSINIESPWPIKPCLNAQDPHDSINKIKPETIANAILKQLQLNTTIPLETKFIGTYYDKQIVEVVPNFFKPVPELQNQLIFLRPDFGFDQNSFLNWCNYLSAYSIFSRENLPIDFCKTFVNKIKNVSFIINKDTKLTIDYLRELESLNISITLLVENEKDLPKLREKFFDFIVHLYFKADKKLLGDDFNFKNCGFNSSKVILSHGKEYPSKYHLQQNKNFIDNNFDLIDNDVLLEELNHFYIYARTK